QNADDFYRVRENAIHDQVGKAVQHDAADGAGDRLVQFGMPLDCLERFLKVHEKDVSESWALLVVPGDRPFDVAFRNVENRDRPCAGHLRFLSRSLTARQEEDGIRPASASAMRRSISARCSAVSGFDSTSCCTLSQILWARSVRSSRESPLKSN